MKVPFSYLDRQFSDLKPYFTEMEKLVKSGDFTLGYPVKEFEENIARVTNAKFAIGVNSGTDALILSLKAAGVGAGDEVITAVNTFYATAGAIVAVGAKPVFVDVDDTFLIDCLKIERAITQHTKAIIPVHYMGLPVDMAIVLEIARRHHLAVIEDACQAFGATINGQHTGTFGMTGAFSFHPLKNLNVWGDAGIIITNDKKVNDYLVLYRNHCMASRDEISFYGINSRLDSLQAVVGNVLIKTFDKIKEDKKKNAGRYNDAFAKLAPQVRLPLVKKGFTHAYHLYMLYVERRDELLNYLIAEGIEAKVHYPLPLHLQKASALFGYKAGDFPVCEDQCNHYITLPVHQHLTDGEVGFVIDRVTAFYKR
jgi:dTDP-3-amino-2,3,6-trideoxy-4-keto-D-glucose/dTDP-3-amino-3,4,6-trideoxy-alpha-D-glucose/dTDP-2,6-dideoxy-D-kanosamine transaminase